MADVYLGTNVGFTPRDVILRPSSIVATSTPTVTGGGRNPLPSHRLPRRTRDDEEALLVAALI